MARQRTRSIVWAVPFIVTLMVSPSALVPPLLVLLSPLLPGVSGVVSPFSVLSLPSTVLSAGAGVGLALAIWSTVTVCSGSVPSAPLFRSVSTAFVEPATSVRPAISLSALAISASVRCCISLAAWLRSVLVSALSLAVWLLPRLAAVAALCLA